MPVVYAALRRLAHKKMDREPAGHTLQPTALVHEAFLRLRSSSESWNGPGHFYGAAAEAMRRILVERARRYGRLKHGKNFARVDFDVREVPIVERADELLALDRALVRLERESPGTADLVKLRYFIGYTIPEAAERLGVSQTRLKSDWAFARAWLHREMAAHGNEAG